MFYKSISLKFQLEDDRPIVYSNRFIRLFLGHYSYKEKRVIINTFFSWDLSPHSLSGQRSSSTWAGLPVHLSYLQTPTNRCPTTTTIKPTRTNPVIPPNRPRPSTRMYRSPCRKSTTSSYTAVVPDNRVKLGKEPHVLGVTCNVVSCMRCFVT